MLRKITCIFWLVLVLVWGGSAWAWTSVDVGTPAPGNATFDEVTGTWTIAGNGHDIWDNSDNFHFVYKYLVGDGALSARVVAWGAGSNAWAKAGVMMREDLTGGSRHAMAVITGGNGGGGSVQGRLSAGGGSSSVSDPSPAPAPPWYVRIERTGDELRGYFSQDGLNWTQHGPALTLPLRNGTGTKAACYIGLCVTSHATGELRTATFDSVVLEGEIFDAPPPQLEAYAPVPQDGTTGVKTPLLEWTAGDTASLHKVYLSTSPDLTEADVVAPMTPLQLYFHGPGLEPGATYYWRIDEIESDGTTHIGTVWSFTAAPLTAFEPVPPPGANFQDIETDLSWGAGATAVMHDVYLSTDQQQIVNGAPEALVATGVETTFDPGPLTLETTYYWRIDEIDSLGQKQVGRVWSFATTVPGLGSAAREIWEDIDGTALDALRNDPRFPDAPTVADELPNFESPEYGDNYGGRLQAWLHVPIAGEYTFWVAGDDNTELFLGADPGSAERIADVPSWTGAQAWDTLPTQKSEPIFLEADRYYIAVLWKEGGGGDHASAAWQGPGVPQRSLITGSFLKAFEAVWAVGPSPSDVAVDVPQIPTLRWSPGVRAVQHDVYFGNDAEIVANADTGTAGIYQGRQPLDLTTYEPGALEWNTTYYWRIDEVNEAHPESPWIGSVWSFTVADFIVVDDFEGYTDDVGNRIFQTWIDGLGYTEPTPGNPGNGTSSTVGNISPPFAEQTIVYAGAQAMPMDYNNANSPWFSQADHTWPTPQDMTVNETKALTLHFRGYPVRFEEPAPGEITMSAAGADIWGTADEFRFAYKQLSGDGSITARVESLVNTDGWAKAGVMIRESLEPGSRHAYMVVTPSNGVSFGGRAFANDITDSTTEGGIAAPHWVRLTREADTLMAEHSVDGVTWVGVNDPGNPTAVDIPMPGDLFIGLALTSHSAGNVTVAEFSSVSTDGGAAGQWQIADVGVAQPGNLPDPLYVVVEDSAGRAGIMTHPDPEAVLLSTWQEWNIALAEFAAAGADLSAVKALHIGVGDPVNPQPSGFGRLFIDEIRVYKSRCVPSMAKPAYDLNDDCVVDYLDLESMAQQWLTVGMEEALPTADVDGDGQVTMPDFARLANTWMEEVLWP